MQDLLTTQPSYHNPCQKANRPQDEAGFCYGLVLQPLQEAQEPVQTPPSRGLDTSPFRGGKPPAGGSRDGVKAPLASPERGGDAEGVGGVQFKKYGGTIRSIRSP